MRQIRSQEMYEITARRFGGNRASGELREALELRGTRSCPERTRSWGKCPNGSGGGAGRLHAPRAPVPGVLRSCFAAGRRVGDAARRGRPPIWIYPVLRASLLMNPSMEIPRNSINQPGGRLGPEYSYGRGSAARRGAEPAARAWPGHSRWREGGTGAGCFRCAFLRDAPAEGAFGGRAPETARHDHHDDHDDAMAGDIAMGQRGGAAG
eukprot:gene969-biopygen3891